MSIENETLSGPAKRNAHIYFRLNARLEVNYTYDPRTRIYMHYILLAIQR
jgi:hypothetical protein